MLVVERVMIEREKVVEFEELGQLICCWKVAESTQRKASGSRLWKV
jgi:hypothetical protein